MSTNRQLHWHRLECRGDVPVGRVGETLTTSPDQNHVFMYGGMVEPANQPAQYLDDFFVFDPVSSSWSRRELVPVRSEDAASLQPRAFHTTVTHNGQLYIFGGCSEAANHNGVLCINPDTATRELVRRDSDDHGTPAPRYCHSAVVFEDAMYIFGGKSGARDSNERLADIFRFEFASCRWSEVPQLGDLPPPRSAHSAVVCGRRMYVFGGRQSDRCCGDMYEYAFDTHTWRRMALGNDAFSLERARHSAVIHNGVIAVFGGWNGRRKLNDLFLHSLDGTPTEASTEEETRPTRRDCHVAVMWRNTMLVFSGRYRVSALDDVQALRLGPSSLVEQCRDWLTHHRIGLDYDALPARLAGRLRAWRAIHGVSPNE